MSVNYDVRNKLPVAALVFDNFAYDNSIVGITFDGRVIYVFERMVKELMEDERWNELEAIEWIDFNTLRALPYFGDKAPIVLYSNDW